MAIPLTLKKKDKKINLYQKILREDAVALRFLSKLRRNLVADFAAVILGPLYYRTLEMDKAQLLKQSKGNYDPSVRLSNEVKKKLCWWITNKMSSLQHIHVLDAGTSVYTNSRTLGWGVTKGNK